MYLSIFANEIDTYIGPVDLCLCFWSSGRPEVQNCPRAFKKCLANVGLSHFPIAEASIKYL